MSPTVIFRRVVAIAITLGVPSLVWLAILQPVLCLSFREPDDLQAERTKLAVLRRSVRQGPILQARLQAAQKALALSSFYWHQPSTADISPMIQARIRQLVAEAGGMVVSTADLGSHRDHDFLQVQVRAQIAQPLRAFYKTLHSLESSTPALVVESLNLRPLQSGSPADEPQVGVDIVLSAYQPVGE